MPQYEDKQLTRTYGIIGSEVYGIIGNESYGRIDGELYGLTNRELYGTIGREIYGIVIEVMMWYQLMNMRLWILRKLLLSMEMTRCKKLDGDTELPRESSVGRSTSRR